MLCKNCNQKEANEKYQGLCPTCRVLHYEKRLDKRCPHCGISIFDSSKTCRSCSQIHKLKRKQVVCIECGVKFEAKTYESNRKYCSRKCQVTSYARKFRLGGENSIAWKGTDTLESTGYVTRRDAGRKRRTRIHILIAEKILGRRLKKGEVVHHINMNKADNRNSNLLICTQSYHRWIHHQMELDWVRRCLKEEN